MGKIYIGNMDAFKESIIAKGYKTVEYVNEDKWVIDGKEYAYNEVVGIINGRKKENFEVVKAKNGRHMKKKKVED